MLTGLYPRGGGAGGCSTGISPSSIVSSETAGIAILSVSPEEMVGGDVDCPYDDEPSNSDMKLAGLCGCMVFGSDSCEVCWSRAARRPYS